MFSKKPSGVGISLHASHLEIACMKGRNLLSFDRAQVEHVPFPQNHYDNARVNDVHQFANKVNQIFDALKLPRQNVTVSLPSSVVVLRPMMVPNLKKHKIREVIEFQIGKEIHLPFANPVFDFDFLPPSLEVVKENGDAQNGNQNTRHTSSSKNDVPVLLVAAPAEIVNGLKHAFEQANVELSVMEVKGISIMRALKAIGRSMERDLLLLEFGVDRVEAHIYQKGALVFTRTLELSPARYVASAVEAEVTWSETKGELMLENQDGSADSGAWSLLEEGESEQRFEHLVDDLSYQLDRVLNFFDYTFQQSSGSAVKDVWLTGHVPFPKKVVERLNEQTDMLNIRLVHVPALLEKHEKEKVFLPSLSSVGTALKGLVRDAN